MTIQLLKGMTSAAGLDRTGEVGLQFYNSTSRTWIATSLLVLFARGLAQQPVLLLRLLRRGEAAASKMDDAKKEKNDASPHR